MSVIAIAQVYWNVAGVVLGIIAAVLLVYVVWLFIRLQRYRVQPYRYPPELHYRHYKTPDGWWKPWGGPAKEGEAT